MENILTSLDIRNPGLRTLPPGVERYFVRGGGLSVFRIIQSLENFHQFCLIISSTLISPLLSGFK